MSTHKTSTRRYDIDWLRVLAVLTVFIFHSTRFFDTYGWHVKNPNTYPGVDAWTTFLALWMMPLIFAISGASTFFALGSRGAGKFLKERAARLLVPLAVGAFTHVALQVYLERLTHGEFRGSFFAFVPHYFDGLYALGGNFAWMGLHLWYLEILFVFSLICLPLLLWLRRGSGARLLHRLGEFVTLPGAIYLLALPIVLLLIGLDPETPLGARPWGGWSLLPHLFFFLYGFLIISHRGLQERIRRQRWISLVAGLLLFVTFIVLKTFGGDPAFGTPRYDLLFSVFGLSAWCWIIAMWGFGRQHLNFSTPSLSYANQAVLPFYVMHQTVLLVVGYFVVGWAIPDLLKLGVISLSSFALILLAYEFLIRRNNLVRVLFGMKPRPRTPPPAAPSPLPQTAKS